MKLDEIQDIEVLRNELKKRMVKCIKTTGKEICKFNEGEYYVFEFDHEEQWYYVEYANNKNVIIYDCEMEKYFELPKEGN